jgi:hypothetical protein
MTACNRPSASERDLRPLRISDLTVLVVATAIGCGLAEWISRTSESSFTWRHVAEGWFAVSEVLPRGLKPPEAIGICSSLAAAIAPIAAVWTVATLLIRFMPPRPSWHLLTCQPGVIATCAASMAIGLVGTYAVILVLVVGEQAAFSQVLSDRAIVLLPIFVGESVAAAWLALAIGRRWRSERNSVDRIGRSLGIFWISAGLTMSGLLMMNADDSGCYGFGTALIDGTAARSDGSKDCIQTEIVPRDE